MSRIRLVARVAALRLVPRGATGQPGRERGWRPMALRWRRGLKRRQAARAREAGRAQPGGRHAPLHLHFDIRPTALRLVTSNARLAAIAPRETVRDPPRESSRYVRTSVLSRTPRTPLGRRPGMGTTPAVAGARAAVVRTWSLPRAPTLGARDARRPRIATAGRLQQGAREHATAIECSQPLDTRTPPRRPHLRLHHASSVALRRGEPAPGSARTVAQARLDRAPDLVWRRIARPAENLADPTRRSAPPDRASPSAAAPAESAQVRASIRTTAAAAVHPAQFDAAILDRLADDVIRRVDRRVRIERERRGY